MELKDLEKTLQLMRKYGVTELTLPNATIKLSEHYEAPSKAKGKSVEAVKPSLPEYTPDQVMMWSSAGVDIGDTE